MVEPALAPKTRSRRGWVVTAAAVMVVVGTARLGVWQLDRATQKQALQALIDARAALPPLDVQTLARTADQALVQHYRGVRLEGHWVAGATIFLDNRQMRARPGFFVVTPLALDDGTVVLVQRGWVGRDARERSLLPALPLMPGRVALQGRIAPPPQRLYEFDTDVTGPIRQNIDLDAFAHETRLTLRPLSIQQTVGDDGGGVLLRDWPSPSVDVDKNYGYAFQWFALACLVTGLYVWFQLIRPHRRVR